MATQLMELSKGSHEASPIVLDVSDKEIKKFKIGEKVTVIIKGSVGMLSVPPKGSSEHFPAEIGIRMTSKKIEGSNVFTELAEDDC